MGLLARLRYLSTPRAKHSGGSWDNINTTTAVKPPATTVNTSNSVPARTNAFVPGPNVEYYLRTTESKSTFRHFVSFDTLQPEIPVREPWASSAVYVNGKTSGTSGTQQNPDVKKGAYVGPVKSLAPPMTRQRDNLYDAGDYKNLQRFVFANTESQRYFDQKTALPEYTTPAVWTNMIQTNEYPMKKGWDQEYVPEPGMRENEEGTSPPYLLSTPLRVTTLTRGVNQFHRPSAPMKAPKRKRSGG